MEHETQYNELVSELRKLGNSDEEIVDILTNVRDYDDRTILDSVMDRIDIGSIDLGSIVQEITNPTNSRVD